MVFDYKMQNYVNSKFRVVQNQQANDVFIYNLDEIESMELMLKNMKSTKTNVDFFDMMRRGG